MPFADILRRQRGADIELGFAEIERILWAMLPHAASVLEWWNNDAAVDGTGVQQAAWRGACYRALLVKHAERVRFQRHVEPRC